MKSMLFSVLVPVQAESSISLSFLVSRPGAKWDIMVTQEQCVQETQQEIVDENTEAVTTPEPDIQGMTCNAKFQAI